MWLTLLKLFIGYGYRIYYALYWTGGLIGLGMAVLSLSGQGPQQGLQYWGCSYSVDMLLPIIELDKQHDTITLTGWVRVYFYVHKVFGYVLASFLLVGLSGLTK